MRNLKIFSLILCLGYAFFSTARVEAVGIPFGGIVTVFRPCLTGVGFQIIVVRPPGIVLPLTWYPGTPMFAKYMPFPGHFLLGKFAPGGFCDGFPSVGTILYMGTS